MPGDLFSYLNNRFSPAADPSAASKSPTQALMDKIGGFREEMGGPPR